MNQCKETCITYLDQNNLFHRYKKLDFKKLLNYIKEEFDVLRATSYNAYDYNNEAQKKFNTYLSNQGWRCKTVDTKINTNIDNMLSVDMTNDMNNLEPDWVALISGDGDYAYVLDEISKKGIRVLVLGPKDNTSLELLKIADKIIYLENIPNIILETNN